MSDPKVFYRGTLTVRLVSWVHGSGPVTQVLSAEAPSRTAVRMMLLPYAARCLERENDVADVEIYFKIMQIACEGGA